jgi:tetratricopeptide (TPR) repeat protein
LALCIAGAYLRDRDESAEDYLTAIGIVTDALIKKGTLTGLPLSVAATAQLSLERLTRVTPAAMATLNLCVFIGPNNIPVGLFSMLEGADGGIRALGNYGFASGQEGLFSLHRLTQHIALSRLGDDDIRKYASTSARLLAASLPQPTLANRPSFERIALHALVAAEHCERLLIGGEAAGKILNQIGLYRWITGEPWEAVSLFERAIVASQSALGDRHPDIAAELTNLGLVLHDLGELSRAKETFELSLKISLLHFGDDHQENGLRHNHLGQVLRDLGAINAARAHLERAIKIGEQTLGADSIELATWRNNLGSTFRLAGEPALAKEEFLQAIAIGEKILGPNHRNVGAWRNNLASALHDLGDHTAARNEYEKAIAIGVETLPDNQPDLGLWRANFAAALFDLGDRAEAAKQFETAHAIYVNAFGETNPKTVALKNNLIAVTHPQINIESVTREAIQEISADLTPTEREAALQAAIGRRLDALCQASN